MDWSDYYDRFYGWADSTQVSRISSIESFGDVSDQVAEIVQNLFDEKAASRLVRGALAHGVRFTSSEIEEMILYLDKIPDELLLSCRTSFTQEEIDSISLYYHNQEVLDKISKNSGLQKDDTIYISEYNFGINVKKVNVSKPQTPKITVGQVFGAIVGGLFGGLFGSNKKHSGRCDGDCANCPPHFGYRYGRWYYGHGHNYGCQFGGNRGGGNQ